MNKRSKFLSIFLVLTILLSSSFRTFASAKQEGVGYYYGQLDADGKEIYQKLSNINPQDDEIKINFEKALLSQADAVNFCLDFATSLYEAFTAFLYDRPDKFWLKKQMKLQFSYVSVGPLYNFTITIQLQTEPAYQANINSMYNKFYSELNSVFIEESDRYEKVKAIYEYLCKTVKYESNNVAHSAYGALVEKAAVCEGYAEAFKLLCNREGIPCVIVSGSAKTLFGSENHMWNYVQMEDDKWYAVDVTWGDQDSSISYDYLLVGENSIIKNTSFSTNHIPDNSIADFTLTSSTKTEHINVCLDYPQLSKQKYEPTQKHNPTPPPEPLPIPEPIQDPFPQNIDLPTYSTETIIINKDVKAVLIGVNLEIDNEKRVISNVQADMQISNLIENYDSLTTYVLNNKYEKLSANDLAGTGTEIHFYQGVNYLTYYTVVVKGDVDGNGKINAVDARATLRASAGLIELDDFEFDAADVQDKDKLSASSARKILRVSSQLESF